MDNFKVIEKLDENQIEELHSLFKNEWWTQKRQITETRKLLENSSVVIGLIHDEIRRTNWVCKGDFR